MFSSSNKLEIYTEKPAYQPGETIKGTVVTKVVSKQAVKGIYLTIEGMERTKITKEKLVKLLKDDGQNSIFDTTDNIIGDRQKIFLSSPPPSRHNNNDNQESFIEDVSRSENIIIRSKYLINDFVGKIDVGQYSIPFEIKLPNILRSSFEKNLIGKNRSDYGEVVYSLKAEVAVKNTFAFNWGSDIPITIYNRTRIPSRPATFEEHDVKLANTCCFCNQGTYDTSITVNGDVFSPGDRITGTINVTSKAKKRLTCSVKLIRYLKYNTKETSEEHVVVGKCQLPDIRKECGTISTSFSITIPKTGIPASYQSNLISCYYLVIYSVSSGWSHLNENGPIITMKHFYETFFNESSSLNNNPIVSTDLPPVYSSDKDNNSIFDEKGMKNSSW